MSGIKDYIVIFAKGLCMGATEVVQGVSGSTMALILGVYQELILSLKAVDRKAFHLLRHGNFFEFWEKINGAFLATLLTGIILSLFTLTQIVTYFLQKHFIATSSLLFGIISISGILLLRKVKKWTYRPFIAIVFGIALNFFLTQVSPTYTQNNTVFAFLCGFLSGFSLVFPGISSAFILLLIGKYQYIVTSFSALNVQVIATFILGALPGLWMASRFMYKLLTSYYSVTIALLAGLMLGALNKLWPWRMVMEYVTNAKGEQVPAFDKSVLPWDFVKLTGKDPQVFLAILMIALGVFVVVLIEKIAAGLKTKI